ncbi:MAG: O-antigen ligase family protein [Odoribacter sp.]
MSKISPTYNHFISVVVGILSTLIGWILYVNDSTLANSDVTSKYFWLCGTTTIAMIAIGILWEIRHTAFHFKAQDLWVVLFIGYVLINAYTPLVPMNVHTSILILWGVTYFIFRGLATIVPQGNQIISLVVVAFGVAEIYTGFGQLYGFTASNHSMYRLTGSFFNPGPYSGFLVTLLPLALYWMLRKYPITKQFSFVKLKDIVRSPEQIRDYLLFGLSTFYVVGVITILPAGMSRSAWLAGAIGCGIVVGKQYRIWHLWNTFYKSYRQRTVIGGVAALLLVGGIGTGMYLMKKDSADGRLLMWKVSTLSIKEHPLTGVGAGKFAGTFGEVQSNYFASGKATHQEEWVAGSPEYGFNEYLQIAVEDGCIGLILFLLIIGTALLKANKSKQEGSNGVIGALMSMLVFACFSYPFRVVPLCLLFVILLAMTDNVPQSRKQEIKSAKWRTRGFALCLLCLTFYITQEKEQRREAYSQWRNEQAYYKMEIYEGTVDQYRKLYGQLREEPKFLFEWGHCLSKTSQYEESNRILKEGARLSSDPMFWNIMGKNYQAMKQYKEAEACFVHSSQMVPHRLYPLYLLANLYFSGGQEEKGVAMAKRVIDKEPKVMSPAIKEMKMELQTSLQQYNHIKK